MGSSLPRRAELRSGPRGQARWRAAERSQKSSRRARKHARTLTWSAAFFSVVGRCPGSRPPSPALWWSSDRTSLQRAAGARGGALSGAAGAVAKEQIGRSAPLTAGTCRPGCWTARRRAGAPPAPPPPQTPRAPPSCRAPSRPGAALLPWQAGGLGYAAISAGGSRTAAQRDASLWQSHRSSAAAGSWRSPWRMQKNKGQWNDHMITVLWAVCSGRAHKAEALRLRHQISGCVLAHGLQI